MTLALVLGLCCGFSGVVGSSRVLFVLGLFLFIGAESIRRFRSGLGESYQLLFRDRVTREWFRLQIPDAYLAPAPPPNQVPLEILKSLREACLRASDQVAARTVIEERIFFETDSSQTWTFILRERARFSGATRSRALVWFRAFTHESLKVAFVWPAASPSLSRAPDIRFFDNGKPISATEPLRTKLLETYEFIRARSSGQTVRLAVAPSGLWAGVKLVSRPFRAPVTESCLEAQSYVSWLRDAQLLNDREITRALAWT